MGMAFIIDKEVLKSGLIIFRRGDVEHRNFFAASSSPRRTATRPFHSIRLIGSLPATERSTKTPTSGFG
jgi:hypothetical protein